MCVHEKACSCELRSFRYSIDAVQSQKMDRGSTDSGKADDSRPIHSEMFLPSMDPGMKKGCQSTGRGVQGSDVAALAKIAQAATKGQIGFVRHPAVLFSNDVIDLMRTRREFLWKQTVFTPFLGAIENPFPERGGWAIAHDSGL